MEGENLEKLVKNAGEETVSPAYPCGCTPNCSCYADAYVKNKQGSWWPSPPPTLG